MNLSKKGTADLAALATHLTTRREPILNAWCQAIQADPQSSTASPLSRAQFLDHIPTILDQFEARLRAGRGPEDAAADQEAKEGAAQHGRHRWQQGFRLREVVREWGYLHLVLLEEIEDYGMAHPETDAAVLRLARRALAELCGEGVAASADQFFDLRQAEAAGNVRELERALAQWEAQDRQQGEAWREAAHDLRGSLGVFRNVTYILSREGVPDRVRADSVALLQKSVVSMQSLLEDVLSLARLQAGHEQRLVEPFDAAEILADLCATAQCLASERGLVLTTEGPPSLPVEGDGVKVRRIVQNLLLNALKYTTRGSVAVSWGGCTEDDPKRWRVCIRDTGPGLHTGAAAPLTQALAETTQEVGASRDDAGETPQPAAPGAAPEPVGAGAIPGGEGIGLAIVKRLCELLDATLEVESQAGVGTTFRVLLPCRYEPA